jgi:hypothetical protein
MGRKFYVAKGKEKLGPFSRQQVIEGIRSKIFLRDDLGWVEGMDSWVKLAKISLFKPIFENGSVPDDPKLDDSSVGSRVSKKPDKPLKDLCQLKPESVVDHDQTFHLSSDGKTLGEFPFLAIVRGLQEGSVLSTNHVWQPGWESWRQIDNVHHFNDYQSINVGFQEAIEFFKLNSIGSPITSNRKIKKPKKQILNVFIACTIIAFVGILYTYKGYRKVASSNTSGISVIKNKKDAKVQVSNDEAALIAISSWWAGNKVMVDIAKNQFGKRYLGKQHDSYLTNVKKINPKIIELEKIENGSVNYKFKCETFFDILYESGDINKNMSSVVEIRANADKKFEELEILDFKSDFDSIDKAKMLQMMRNHDYWSKRKIPRPSDYDFLFIKKIEKDSVEKSEYDKYLNNKVNK